MCSKTFFVLFCVYFISNCSCGVIENKCKDYTFKKATNSFYKIHNTRKSWLEAKAICESEDALLFYPDNRKEAEMIRDWWLESTNTVVTYKAYPFIFVGVTNANVEGQYKTVDGIPISQVYHEWAAGEPNNMDGDEHCGELYYDLTLNDIKCDGTAQAPKNQYFYLPFVCKKKPPCHKTDPCGVIENQYKDYTFKKATNSFYKIHNTRKSWLEAKAICESEDTLLFYPDNSGETEMVRNWWIKSTNTKPTNTAFAFIFLGITNANVEGQYKTVDGIPISQVYHEWAPGEPYNLGGDEHCGVLYYDLKMNDVKCNGTELETNNAYFYLPFVCKKKLSCPKTDSTYVYNKGTDSYYKFQLKPLNWMDAKAACTAEHAHLAIINSQLEADYLASLTAAAPIHNITGDFLLGAIHLGFHNQDGKGWKTIEGTKLESSGYAVWGNQQPDGKGLEKCGSMFYNGHLNDIDCEAKCFYICESKA